MKREIVESFSYEGKKKAYLDICSTKHDYVPDYVYLKFVIKEILLSQMLENIKRCHLGAEAP